MRSTIIALFIFVAPVFVNAQITNEPDQTALVKSSIGGLAGRGKPKVSIILRDMREFEGKIVAIYDDHFVLQKKDNKGKRRGITVIKIGSIPSTKPQPIKIRYENVLQLEGNKLALSFVPDPSQASFASWEHVRRIGVGEFLQIESNDGDKDYGVFLEASDDSIALMRGNTKNNFKREVIARIFQMAGDTHGLPSRMSRGAKKGADIADDLFPIGDARAATDPLTRRVGAAVGAIVYLLPIGGTKRVLVYSR